MSKNVVRNGSSETATPEVIAESDDDISVTSTVPEQHDSDDEFGVENILAEQVSDDGEMFYLVEWTGFPLHQSSWEPEINLGDELKAIWEDTKRKQASGEAKPFDVQRFYESQLKAAEDKMERHRRRNAKRKRLRLPMTPPLPGPSPSDSASDNDEAAQDLYIEGSAPGSSSKLRSQSKPKTGKGTPQKVSGVAPKTTATAVEGSKNQSEARRSSTAKPATGNNGSPTVSKAKAKIAPRPPIAQPERSTSTGYQGTARKLPARPLSSDPTLASKPLNASRVGASSSSRTAGDIGKGFLTAKKTTVNKRPTSNIFSGGKVRKTRVTLTEAMSDTSKEPKLFGNFRTRRLAEKRGREKEDLAPPDASTLHVFAIPKGPVSSKTSIDTVLSPIQQESPLEATSAIASPDALLKKKRKSSAKSVRFLDDDPETSPIIVQEPEPMDVDSPENIAPSPAKELPASAPPAVENIGPKKLSLAAYRSKVLTQSLEKNLVLGRSAALKVNFDSLPRDPPQAWLSHFMAKDTLEFQYTCFAKTMIMKFDILVQNHLAEGTITSEANAPVLEDAAEYLRSDLLGFFYTQSEYSILIYPTKCDEWRTESLSQEPTSPSGSPIALRYLIFSSAFDCGSMLRPFAFLPPVEKVAPKTAVVTASAREIVMKRFFKFDYTQLLPAYPKQPPVHLFFLAFPRSKQSTLLAVNHWLKACNPDCHIFTSCHAGGWAAFCAGVEQMPGVVIVHEALAWSLHRFPKLSERLIHKHDQYWCLSEPSQPYPIYPSISVPESPAAPGDLSLTRLFPYRTAILLTPGFLVSEPQRACQFLDWFLTSWAKSSTHRLVTAWNIHEYLLGLAMEKAKARDDIFESDEGTPIDHQLAANLHGVSHTDCNARFKSTIFATELHNLKLSRAGPFGADDDNCSLIYADQCIDPNDEQSLVNWFGWWSTLRADQYQKFHVVGSSRGIKIPGRKSGDRIIPIPRYTQVTLNDPDVVLETVQSKDDPIDQPDAANGSHSNPATPAQEGNGEKTNQTTKPPWSFQSNLIASENSQDITDFLNRASDVSDVSDNFKFLNWTLYKFPISWADTTMGDHYGDFSQHYRKINDWFSFPWSWVDLRHPKSSRAFNTYIGFFYTVAEDWDPRKPPPDRKPKRHPWLAIYRPVNPHNRPYSRCEIIIWDPAAKTRFPGNQAPVESGFLDMQRRVIQHARNFGSQKNPGTWIDQVWLGGFEFPEECESPHPIDMTLKFLYLLLRDIKTYLPAPDNQMPSRGWKKVVTEKPSSGSIREDLKEAMDIDSEKDDESEDENTRIIFHPPRATKLAPGQRSKCINKLYEDARLAKARAKSATHMLYSFTPTLEWYEEQRAEGRSFEHVNVESWENIFNYYHIGTESERQDWKASV
ncbi:hypothetical protein B0H63DRAFT_154004 [Podospora didyma]|uniref:Chromo domain-containing protein n=1 Tax=Podospora didyma TaxID=330526 RepID=A0AAE0NTJ1_9PEZI|nr:hypothetical protein B0H63DRAFT_154004 [Podospora didyma]